MKLFQKNTGGVVGLIDTGLLNDDTIVQGPQVLPCSQTDSGSGNQEVNVQVIFKITDIGITTDFHVIQLVATFKSGGPNSNIILGQSQANGVPLIRISDILIEKLSDNM